MTAAGSRNAIRTAVKSGTNSNHGLMTKLFCSPSAKEAACVAFSAEWFKLTTKKIISAMVNDGTVVMII